MKNPILKYFGSKHSIRNKIIPLIPKTRHFRSVFVGGGGVEFCLDPIGTSQIWNDLDGEITNFYQVLQNPSMFAEFVKLCNFTPFSESAFERSKIGCNIPLDYFGSSVSRAHAYFTRNRLSRGGDGKSFANTTSRLRRNINENVSAYLSAIDGLQEFHNRIMYVEIRNMHFREFIPKFDRDDAFFLLDPPYLKETRVAGGYNVEMTAFEHEELLSLLKEVKGKYLIHCYPSELYENFVSENNLYTRDFSVIKSSSSAKTKPKAVERIITNYPLDTPDE